MNSPNEEVKDRVLFVDDEPFILFSLRRFFKQNNIEVDVETDCFKAVELIRENKYKVIISDFRMPSMNGAEFLEIAKDISPDSIRLVLSAHITQEALSEIVNKSEVYRYLSKPWKDKDLLNIVKDSISKYDRDTKKVLRTQLMDIPVVQAVSPVEVEAVKVEVIKNDVEPDLYLINVLPEENFENLDLKKLSDVLRSEEHAHLGYVINLVSNKIGLHCKRVSQLSAHIARALKLTQEQQKNIYFAGMYHDIGKIYELAAQVEHSELGFNILSQFHELKEAAKIVRYHHKRIDGEGASEIPIESKILAIVDHFDKAINQEKKSEDEKPRTLTDIIGEMMSEKGKKFDAEIMDAFKEIIMNDFKLDMFFSETKVHITEIEEGMILSRPMFNVEGKMLLNSDYKITKEIIGRLFKHHKLIPIKSPFYIYTKAPEKTFNFDEFLGKKIAKVS